MIAGARNWNKDDLWYAQSIRNTDGESIPNAAIENLLRMDDIQDRVDSTPKSWLESCKCHSMYNAALATRKDPDKFESEVKDRLRGVRGPDYLCIWMSTPQNRSFLGITPDCIMPSEQSDLYPKAMMSCFGVGNDFRPSHDWNGLKALLVAGNAVVASLSVGHSIMFKGYDDATEEAIYVDPYPKNRSEEWKNMRMGKSEHDIGIKLFINVFPGEA
jgi:hypothetical protein